MSYRYYLTKTNKKDVEMMRNMDFTDLLNQFSNKTPEIVLNMLDVLENNLGNEMYQFGSDFDADILQKIKKEDFFKEKETKENFKQYEVMILNEESFKYIAEYYEEKIKRHMELLLTKPNYEDGYALNPSKPNPIKNEEEILKDEFILRRLVKDQIQRQQLWSEGGVLNKNKNEKHVNNSWLYEYAVFDMIKFYKEANFEKNYYIIYGY